MHHSSSQPWYEVLPGYTLRTPRNYCSEGNKSCRSTEKGDVVAVTRLRIRMFRVSIQFGWSLSVACRYQHEPRNGRRAAVERPIQGHESVMKVPGLCMVDTVQK